MGKLYEIWFGDECVGECCEEEMERLCEAGCGYHFVPLNE